MSDPSWTDDSAENEPDGSRPRDRNTLLIKAVIRLPQQNYEKEVRVRNLSAGGLMAEAPVRVANGDIVEVDLRNIGWVPGRVAWTADGRFGISFDTPVDPAVVRMPVGHAKPDLPFYLEKLNKQQQPKIRRV